LRSKNTETSISEIYQNLSSKHKGYLWMLVGIAIWGQVLFVFMLIATFATPASHGATILESYQSLPPNHRAYLWMPIFITLWSQLIIIVGGWLRKLIKRENIRLKEEIAKFVK